MKARYAPTSRPILGPHHARSWVAHGGSEERQQPGGAVAPLHQLVPRGGGGGGGQVAVREHASSQPCDGVPYPAPGSGG